jgi:hypothetical protein
VAKLRVLPVLVVAVVLITYLRNYQVLGLIKSNAYVHRLADDLLAQIVARDGGEGLFVSQRMRNKRYLLRRLLLALALEFTKAWGDDTFASQRDKVAYIARKAHQIE